MSTNNVQRKRSVIKSIKYDFIRHQLEIIIRNRKYSYLAVPESVYAKLIHAEFPDPIYWEDVHNKYPVVLEMPPIPKKIKRAPKKKSASKPDSVE